MPLRPDSDGDADADADADTDTDTDADADSDSDGECLNPSYSYPQSCIGDNCRPGNTCCAGALCNDELFPNKEGNTDTYINWYCYPECDPAQPDSPCECDDVCAGLDLNGSGTGVWQACFPVATAV